jgi:hypothetical protein
MFILFICDLLDDLVSYSAYIAWNDWSLEKNQLESVGKEVVVAY